MSPDGKRLVRSLEGKFEITDVESGKKLGEFGYRDDYAFFRSPDMVIGMARSGDWRAVKDFEVHEYEAATGKKLASSMASNDDRVHIGPPINQGRELVIGVEKPNLVKVWDLTARKLVREFPLTLPSREGRGSATWYGFIVSADGKWIALERGSGPPEIFRGADGKFVLELPEGMEYPSHLFVPGRDMYVAPSNITREVKTGNALDFVAYDINQKKVRAAFRGHETGFLKSAVSADGKVMATGDEAGNVLVWNLAELR
jgi:hypothetical protein